MLRSLLALALVCSACTPAPRESADAPTTTPSPSLAVSPSPAPSADPAVAPSADPSVAPSAAPSQQPAVVLDAPPVVVAPAFPIVTSLKLEVAPINEQAENVVRGSLSRYLMMLNAGRESGSNQTGLRGKFGEVVAAGIAASATPGVKRQFELNSFRIERLLKKSWGTLALAEVMATFVDKTVEGNAPDQWETGRLLLVGSRLFVTDGWDAANGRWFNGLQTVAPEEAREGLVYPVGWFLRMQSWVPGLPVETNYGPGGQTPYQKARQDYLSKLDRTTTIARTFTDVRATVEKYETFHEIRDGLATVLITATMNTTDADGYSKSQPYERRVLVLFGNWGPEIVDEEIAPGTWMSGGDLALSERDQIFA